MKELHNGIWLVHTKAGSKIEIEVKDGLWRINRPAHVFLSDVTVKDLLKKGHQAFFFVLFNHTA